MKQIDKFTLSFNGNVTVADGAKAYIYEDDNEVAQSVSMSVNTGDASVVDIDFGGATLYNTHKYSVVVPENSILSASDGTGYQEIRLNNYQGADYHYDITLASATPANNSEVPYFTDVEMNFNFPTGYNLGLGSKDRKIYLYKGDATEPMAEYEADYTSIATGFVAHINDYALEAGTTYRVVLPAGSVQPGEIGSSNTINDLKDISNPEIVLTYTTPATLEPLHRVSGLTGGVGSDGSIKVVVPSYDFNGNTLTVYPVEGATGVTKKTETVDLGFGPTEKVSWFITCPLYDTTGDAQVKVGDIEMEFTPNPYSDDEVWLVGKAPQDLYAGRTYNITVPAGTLAPKGMEDAASLVSNDETTLSMEGTADPTGITVSGGIAEDAMLAQLGVVAFYVDGTVKAAEGATVKLMQGDEVVKEVPVVVANASGSTIVIADFSDESHAPLALENGAAYTVVLPQGSVLAADDIMTNPELTMAFTGASLVPETETASVSITVGDNFTTVAQAVKGEPYTFSLVPDDGWTVTSVKVGDEPVELTNNAYTIEELTSDTEIVAVLEGEFDYTESEVTGIVEATEYDIRAWSENGKIIIEGLSGYSDNVRVYTLGGTLVGHFVASNSRAEISVPAGVYIIRVSNGQMNVGMKIIHN